MSSDRIPARIALLERFLGLLASYQRLSARSTDDRAARAKSEDAEIESLRSQINRQVVAVHRTVRAAGALKRVNLAGAQIDPFENLLGDFFGHSFLHRAVEQVERAIGAYEASLVDPSLFAESKQLSTSLTP